ncbi:MAG TPA: oligosaccharide flippase family protein, partial [Anaeromyxobacteraceae bacterium]|nr:oligosaccharide flippase family protein [Anaeromyxobacteraceae bacterium]
MTAQGSLLARARPLLAARLASALLGVSLPMVVARVLSPAEYGTYRAALLVAASLALVLPMGVSISLFYFVPREPRTSGRWVAGALAWTWAAGLVAAALLLAGGDLLVRHFGNPALRAQLPWVALSTLFTLGGSALDLALAASGALGAAGLVRAGTELTRAAAMIAGTLALGSLQGALCGLAVAAGLRAALAWVWLSRRFPLELRGAALRRQLGYALPFGAAAVAATAQTQLHLYAVGGAVSAAAFAVYTVGCFQLPIVDVLYTPVSEVLQIGLAELERAGRAGRALALFREAVARLSLALLPLVALLLAVAPAFIALLFSERYLEAAPLFRISLLAVPLAALPLDGVLRATAQNRFMLAVSVAKLAATAVLVLAGFRALGPAGALAGWILAEAAARMAVLVRVGRLLGAGPRDVLPWGDLGRQALAAAA